MPVGRQMARIVDGEASSAWLIVVTKGHKERSACDHLKAKGFETYCPLRPLPAQLARRRGVSAVPLFPRVIFARATLDAYRWQDIFAVRGVASVMCDPGAPRGLKAEFIERIRAREFDAFMEIGLVDPARPKPEARPKDRRQWVKLNDVVDGLLQIGVDEARKSVLVSLLNEGHAAVTQKVPRR